VTTQSGTTPDATQADEKHAVKAEELAEAPDEEAADATDEVTVKVKKKSEVDAVDEAKTTSSSGVAAQGEVRGTQTGETTEAAKVNNGNGGEKKGGQGPTASGATESSASATTNDDTGTKHAKKDATGNK
jgi:hypothetical protein